MQMRTSRATRCPTQSNQLSRLNEVAGFDEDLRLVIIGRINAPTMVDDRDHAAHGQQAGVNDLASSDSIKFGSNLAAEVEAPVEEIVSTAVV